MYQVWAYEWADANGKPIPKRVLFGGMKFRTLKEAKACWYDTMPGRNDKCMYVKC